MAREIKFRAWDKAFNKMTRSVNLYTFGRKHMTQAQLDNQQFMKHIGLACEIMQGIGLHDKDGEDIFESDIVEDDSGQLYVVVWNEQLCGFYLNIPDSQRGKEILSCAASKFEDEPMRLDKIKIRGNLYEHRELLNKKSA